MRIVFLSIIITLIKITLAQDVPFKRSEFPDQRREYRVAKKEKRKGLRLASRGEKRHPKALALLMSANEFNPNNSKLNYSIGKLLMKSPDPYLSLPYLVKAYSLNSEISDDILYLLAKSNHLNGNYDEALKCYEIFSETLSRREKRRLGEKLSIYKQRVAIADSLSSYPVDCRIENLGFVINSRFPEYAPVLSKDGSRLYFASRRPSGLITDEYKPVSGFVEDIYYSEMTDNGWSQPFRMSSLFNSEDNEFIVSVSDTANTYYIRRGSPNGNFYYIDTDRRRPKLRKLSRRINSSSNETSLTFSPDGNTVFFVSDRRGGYGGKDIWISTKNRRGRWSRPVNAGPEINTPYDEESPFMHPDGKTLYFSSQGHDGMGGFDIFKTTYKDGSFSEPENLGYPVNSPSDDLFFIFDIKTMTAFFASNRQGGVGSFDIYSLNCNNDEIIIPYSNAEE